MNEDQATSLLKELLEEIDYDLYKDTYVEQCMEDPESSRDRQEALMNVLKKHVEVS
jgi:predicted hydrolase (HD superfamily)